MERATRRQVNYGFGWYADDLDAQLSPLLLELYRERQPREIDELAGTMWDVLEDEYDLSDVPADKLEIGGAAKQLRADDSSTCLSRSS